MTLRSSLAVVGLLVSITTFAKDTEGAAKTTARKPASTECQFSYNDGWQITVGNNVYYTIPQTSSNPQDRLVITEIARNLAQAGICKF